MSSIKISIYFLVPFIWSMFSILSYIISFQMAVKFQDISRFSLVHFSTMLLLFCLCFAIGFVLLKIVLKPTEELVDRLRETADNNVTRQVQDSKKEKKLSESRYRLFSDELGEYRKVFAKVAKGLELETLQEQFPGITFKSRELAYVLQQVLRVASSNTNVLILGQSGTGKELIADAVQEKSLRKEHPFIKINCGAISPGLLESELFGHEKGAFTGAVSVHKGCFERADKGTLFLDEVGDMPLDVQVKLLRVLQNGEFQRVGGQKTFKVDVRIIAATNKDLEFLVSQGKFREDLFYRLNVFNINIPPLKNRADDIEPLARYFAQKAGKQISDETISFLKIHEWKGNIRELENKIEKAGICCETDLLTPESFDFQKFNLLASNEENILNIDIEKNLSVVDWNNFNLDEELSRLEINFITLALEKNNGIQARAAEYLGIKPRSLWNRVKKFNIDINIYKGQA